jgi:hypothetical protein
MAAKEFNDLLSACANSINSSSLTQLLDYLIEVNWPLRDTEHSEAINEWLLNYFNSQSSEAEKTLVLETVLCWLEQQDDPSGFTAGIDLPSPALLADLCSATTDFSVANRDLMKLWLLRIYNSADEREAVEAAYDRFGQGLGPCVEAFKECLPLPKRAYPCVIRAKQDPVRLLRYAVGACKVVGLRRADSDLQKFCTQTLQKCLLQSLEMAVKDNPWRDNHAEALFAVRLHIRRDLAVLFLNSKRPRRALQHLSNSATELCGRSSLPNEEFGFRRFLSRLGAGPTDVRYGRISRLLYPTGEVIIPNAYLYDFLAFISARAYTSKQRSRRSRARAWTALGRRHMLELRKYYYGEGEVSDRVFSQVQARMEDLYELYHVCYFVLA